VPRGPQDSNRTVFHKIKSSDFASYHLDMFREIRDRLAAVDPISVHTVTIVLLVRATHARAGAILDIDNIAVEPNQK